MLTRIIDGTASGHELVRRAVEPGGVVPVFQPIVRLADSEVVGYEALARFPGFGMAPDVCFAHAAAVGRQVELELASLTAIAKSGSPPDGALLFVNMSLEAVVAPDILALRRALPERLVLEVTEEAAVDDYEQLRENLAQWTAQGVRIAIDDTGSGYASMKHAIKLLPEFLKLDQELIEDVDRDRTRQALVRSLVTFGREVGTTVIAEGVERHGQLQWLREADVALAQGYLFARPARAWVDSAVGKIRRRGAAVAPARDRLEQRLGNTSDARSAADAVVDHLFRRGDVMPSVYLEEDGRLRCYAQRGLWQVLDGLSPDAGITGAAYRTGARQVVLEVAASTDYLQAIPGVVSELCVPIRMDGEVVGALNVDCTTRPEDDLVAELEVVSALLGARLATLGRRARRLPLRTLLPALTPIVRSTTRVALFGALCAAARSASGFDSVMVAVVDGDALQPVAAAGPLADVLRGTRAAELMEVAAMLGVLTSCHSTGDAAGRCFIVTESLRRAGARAMAAIPLTNGESRYGVVIVADSEPHPLSPDEVEALELIGAVAGASLASVAETDALRAQASTDSLTGVGNHGEFYAMVERPHSDPRALVVLDVDRFKQINDQRGHPFGDCMLRAVADALRSVTRGCDRVFRIGGDEFGVLAHDVKEQELDSLVGRVDAVVSRALADLGGEVSIGAAWIAPDTSGVEAFAHADADLYDMKSSKRPAFR